MADSHNQQIEIKNAEKIGRNLEHLWEKFADINERESIAIDEIGFIMKFMAAKFGTNSWHHYQNHFIGHLKLFSELLLGKKQTDDFIETIQRLTEILCQLISKDGFGQNSLCDLLKTWLCCVQRVPSAQRHRVFQKIGLNLWQNCGRFLIEAKCYSMQMRMLNIIFSYLCGREHMTKNPLAFTAMFERVITVTNGLSTAVTDIFNKNAELTLIEKHRLLDLLNHCAPKRSIYSIAITQEANSGWMHLNTASGTVEIWLTMDEKPKKVYIKPHYLTKIEILEAKGISFVVKFQQTGMKTDQSINVMDRKWCDRSKLDVLLRRTFPRIDVKIKSDLTNDSQATTFCSVLENESFTNFVRFGRSSPTLPRYDEKKTANHVSACQKGLALPTESTFYGEASEIIQNNVVSTTKAQKRESSENVQSINANQMSFHDFDAYAEQKAKKRLHAMPIEDAQKVRNDTDIKIVVSELENIIDCANRALSIAKSIGTK